jgi:uncharacterized protein YdeI (BOF family)
MKLTLLVAAAALASTAAFAQTTTTTTTQTTETTGSTAGEFFVVRDPSTKRCTVTTSRPTSESTVVVGNTTYKTRTEAEGAVTRVCTE